MEATTSATARRSASKPNSGLAYQPEERHSTNSPHRWWTALEKKNLGMVWGGAGSQEIDGQPLGLTYEHHGLEHLVVERMLSETKAINQETPPAYLDLELESLHLPLEVGGYRNNGATISPANRRSQYYPGMLCQVALVDADHPMKMTTPYRIIHPELPGHYQLVNNMAAILLARTPATRVHALTSPSRKGSPNGQTSCSTTRTPRGKTGRNTSSAS